MSGLELMSLVAAIIMVESSGNDNAINHREQAYGPMQIQQCVLDDVNRVYRTNYKLSQMRNRSTSLEVFKKYTRIYKADANQESAAKCWNAGPGWKSKTGTAKSNLNEYWRKVQQQLKELALCPKNSATAAMARKRASQPCRTLSIRVFPERERHLMVA